MLRHLPNLLTILRLTLVPVTIYLILGHELAAAFWVFVVAGLTDALDGPLARFLGVSGGLGAYLDPLADKALLVGIYVTLGSGGHLPLWLVLLVVFRDVLIVGGALLVHALTHRLEMQPLWISKLNTALQIGLAALVLAEPALALAAGRIVPLLIYAVAATTVASGAAYTTTWLKRLHEWEQGK